MLGRGMTVPGTHRLGCTVALPTNRSSGSTSKSKPSWLKKCGYSSLTGSVVPRSRGREGVYRRAVTVAGVDDLHPTMRAGRVAAQRGAGGACGADPGAGEVAHVEPGHHVVATVLGDE